MRKGHVIRYSIKVSGNLYHSFLPSQNPAWSKGCPSGIAHNPNLGCLLWCLLPQVLTVAAAHQPEFLHVSTVAFGELQMETQKKQ